MKPPFWQETMIMLARSRRVRGFMQGNPVEVMENHREGSQVMKAILWENQDAHSLEYCHLATANDAFVLEGTVVLLLDKLPARITYKVECDSQWRTKAVVIQQQHAGDTRYLTLEVSDGQIWRAADAVLSFATGFYDIDLEITPATNTLPIRRMGLGQGESGQAEAVWVRFPSLTLEPLRQRYSRIGHRLYQYEGLSIGYQTQLEVDEFGMVVNYHGLWQQVGPFGERRP